MEKTDLILVGLATALGSVAGGYAESCMGEQCWKPAKFEPSAECQSAPLPPSCVAGEFAQVLKEIPGPALEHPQGAEVGAVSGLVVGMILAVLANRLDSRKNPPKRI